MTVEKITHSDGSEISIITNFVEAAKAQVIFAHGAGADMTHEFMNELTELLNKQKINVLRFNFFYMDRRALLGKKFPPDRMPKLLDCYRSVIDYLMTQTKSKSLPLFIGGKSMGSRAAATLLSESEALEQKALNTIKGAFCLGYPFHPAKKPEKLRLEPLQGASKPILIVQGERDTLGNKEEVLSYSLSELCQNVFLADGDHSLKPRVKSGFTHDEHMKSAAKYISKFIDLHSR